MRDNDGHGTHQFSLLSLVALQAMIMDLCQNAAAFLYERRKPIVPEVENEEKEEGGVKDEQRAMVHTYIHTYIGYRE